MEDYFKPRRNNESIFTPIREDQKKENRKGKKAPAGSKKLHL
jgi:hypothetical protein